MTDRPPTLTHQDYKVLSREVMYKGLNTVVHYTLQHRLFDGSWSAILTREVYERPHATAILPYDPEKDRVILIEQFRSGCLGDPSTPWMIEIPAGIHDRNESPMEVAYREAFEEAGCQVETLVPIAECFVSPGGCNEYLYMYCGKINAENVQGIHGLQHENEDIRVINITVEEALKKLSNGDIKTSPAIIALQWLTIHRATLQARWS